MKTIIINVPEKDETFFTTLFKKFHLNPHVVAKEEDEDLIAKWINEGMKGEEVSKAKIYATLRKHGVKI
ncbi:MAG: hypothetical protein EPN85_00010 [Bacteroidetes bacterium]|nr:MAG: hypothetical protein EPN85_00010 [Bacteroidota bacterium]